MSGYVQDIGSRAAAPTSSWAVTLSAAPTAGHVCLLEYSVNGTTTISSIADSRGNTWTRVASAVTTGTIVRLDQWYTLQNVAALQSGDTVTLTLSVGTGNASSCVIRELSATQAYDQKSSSANSSASTTTPTTGSTAATTSANEILWCSFAATASQSGATFTAGSGFSKPTISYQESVSAGRPLMSQFQDVAATGTYSGGITMPTSAEAVGIISTWATAAAPAVSGPPIATDSAQTAHDKLIALGYSEDEATRLKNQWTHES